MVRINEERLKENILALGEIGKVPEGGVTRKAFTQEDIVGREYTASLMEEAGCRVKVDAAGNLIGYLPGKDRTLPSIMIGSHIDTVPQGGLFDGAIGVLGGIECLKVFKEEKYKPDHPIEVVAFSAEEGSALGGTFGSRAMAGQIDPADLTSPQKRIMDANLKVFGLSFEKIKEAKRDPETIKSFLEMHIEQGSILEELKVPIGIVFGIVGIFRYEVTVKGEANHSGSTPMAKRDDALIKASRMVLAVEEFVNEESSSMVGTVGSMQVTPNAINVIPGEVKMTVEFRDINAWDPILVYERLRQFGSELGGVTFKKIVEKEPVRLHPGIQEKISQACDDTEICYHKMASAAGHDAVAMSYLAPTSMIFVPSRRGISHAPEEWTEWEDVFAGTNVLMRTVLAIDKNNE